MKQYDADDHVVIERWRSDEPALPPVTVVDSAWSVSMSLGHVLPCDTAADRADRREVHAEIVRQILLHDPVGDGLADESDVISSQSRPAVALANGRDVSALCHLVGHIFGGRAEKQVRRVDARAVVASVANVQPLGNFTEVQHPRKPMGAYITGSIVPAAGRAVALSRKRRPFPAFARRVNAAQEIVEGGILMGHSADSSRESVGAIPPAVSAARGFSHPQIVPHCESSAALARHLAQQNADEYSRPASVRLGQRPTRPEYAPAPLRPNQPAAPVRQPQPRVVRLEPRRRDPLEQVAHICWVLLVILTGLFGALVLLSMIWPR